MRPFHQSDGVTIYHANALALPLPDESVDVVITSPPYFGLRSYEDDGQHYEGQIGDEATPAEFLDALIAATREMVRVLKPSGSIFVNLGDKYASYEGNRGQGGPLSSRVDPGRNRVPKGTGLAGGGAVRNKSLMLIPERYRIRCVDELGLIARAVIEWEKPNGLPESVTDRVRRSHEDWVHLTKEPRYFTGIDEIREEYAREYSLRDATTRAQRMARDAEAHVNRIANAATRDPEQVTPPNPLGKLPGSVWTIPTQPLTVPWGYGVSRGKIAAYFKEGGEAQAWLRRGARGERRSIRPLPDHFAAFPMEWPRRIIRGWSPSGICVECGEGRRPVAVVDKTHAPRPSMVTALTAAHGGDGREGARPSSVATITGYACACDAPTAPTRAAVVLDLFGGTGTTAMVAAALGCEGISVDLSKSYCRLARWRTSDPVEIARARQVKIKPPKIAINPDDYDGDLLEGWAS